MKKIRNLSGIYFRSKVGDKWKNICFEDLTEEEQDKQMEGRELEWHKRMIKLLSNTINIIGDSQDIVSP